ncbi:hypothetical protein Tco_0047397 [Tanacetum coccineum]
MEYLVNIRKRRALWNLNEDILKNNDSEDQYAVSIKEDTAYPCLHSPKTTKERRAIHRIQKNSIRRIQDIVCEYSGRYQTWSLLQETPNTPYPIPWICQYSEEEEAEALAENMEQFMSKTRTDYGSGVARPKNEEKDSFELKGQFLKELRENTFSAASRWLRNEPTGLIKTWEDLKTKFLNKYCPPGRTAKKIEEINNFQQEPDETLYQVWERFKELLMKCPQHYLTEIHEVILFYNGLDVPTRQILDSRGAVPTKPAANAKKAIQEMAEYSQKWQNGTSRGRSIKTFDGLAAIQAQLNNLGREIKKVNEKVYAAQVGCEQCKGPHYTKDCPLKEEGKTLEEAYYTQLGGPVQGGGYRATAPGFYQRNNANPLYQERRQSMEDTLIKFMGELAKRHEENSNLIKEIRASTDAAIRNQGASIKTLELQIGQMSKVLQERGFRSLPS